MLVLSLLAALAACTPPSGSTGPSGTVRVRLPVIGENGVKSLDVVTLEKVDDLNEMRGRYARFTFAPRLTPLGLRGDPPRARFLRTGEGVYVPTDETSQQMAMVYYEMQKLAQLDFAAGAGDLLTWPRSVGIGARLRNAGAEIKNNAFYEGDSDSMLIVPYDAGALPLAMNPGVLAHEHFHAIFQRVAVGPLVREKLIAPSLRRTAHSDMAALFGMAQETPARRSEESGGEAEEDARALRAFYDGVLLKSVNEGLADVWAWIHTGDAEFLGHSLKAFKARRALRPASHDPGLLPRNRAAFVAEVETVPAALLNDYSYDPGTSIARAFVAMVAKDRAELSLAERREAARRLVKALPAIVQEIRDGKEPGPSRIVEILRAEVEK